MMQRVGWRRAAIVLQCASLASAAGAVVFGTATSATVTSVTAVAPVTLTLKIGGSQLLRPIEGEWQVALADAKSVVQIDPSGLNSSIGRKSLIDGLVDMAASPIGFDAGELETLDGQVAAGQASSFVTVPVSASALVFAELLPRQGIFEPGGVNPTLRVPVPRRSGGDIPSEQALRWLLLEDPTASDQEYVAAHGYKVWDSSIIDPSSDPLDPAPFDPKPGEFLPSNPGKIRTSSRAGSSAAGFMLERYMKERLPTLWARYVPTVKRDVPSENINLAAQGDVDQAARINGLFYEQSLRNVVGDWGANGANCCLVGGYPVGLIKKFESAPLDALQLAKTPDNIAKYGLFAQKVDGVEPSVENIAKAVATSEGMSATTATLPPTPAGAYPFSYVDKLIIRTDHISAAKAAALGAFVRWVAIQGQTYAANTGDVPLPVFHVKAALLGANDIVKAGCPENRRLVGTPITIGPLPGAAAPEAIPVVECGPIPPPVVTTTTTAATTTTTTTIAPPTTTTLPPTTTTLATVVAARTVVTPKVTTTKPTVPATTTTLPPTTRATTTTSKPAATVKATTTTTEAPPPPAVIQPVERPGRQRSFALPLFLGAGTFRFGSRFAKRKAQL
jgi:ABC-type phosphate transport system substrate-binding protein